MSQQSLPANAPGSALRAVLLMCCFGLAWAAAETAVGRQLQEHYDLLQVVWSRYAVHLLLVLIVWGPRRPLDLLRTSRPAFHLLRSLMMLAMPWSFAIAAQRGNPVSLTWAVFWCSPLLLLLLSKLSLGEAPPPWAWAAAALGGAGALIAWGPAAPANAATLVLPLVMAGSFAVYVAMTRSLRSEPLKVNMTFTAVGVFVLLSFWMPFVWVMPTRHDAVVLAAIGGIGLIALIALDRSLASAPAWVGACVMSAQVAFDMFLLSQLAGRLPATHSLLGVMVIAGAIAFACVALVRRPPLVSSR